MKTQRLHVTIFSCFLLNSSLLFSSHTIFIPRQITFDSTYELALSNYDIYHNQKDCAPTYVDIYATPFFQKSRKSCALARYFLPNTANSLTIQENGSGNIGSLSLGLISPIGSTFNSQMTIQPERKAFGSHFNIHFNFDRFMCHLWASIAFTAMKANHNLHLCESNLSAKGILPGLQTATQAFNNPAWCAGKLSPCTLSRSGIDDIQFKLGYDWFFCDEQNHIGIYGVASAPTGKGSHALFLFEPLVGSNHASVGAGLNGDVNLYEDCNKNLNFMFDVKYRYVLRACERRSFDLCPNGDWSRYLQVVKEENPMFSLPGINFFTQQLQITPRRTLEVWTALHYQRCNVHYELGYNLWWRQNEKACFPCTLPQNIGILDIPGLCSLLPVTADCFNISQSINGSNTSTSDAAFTSLTNANINLSSAAQPTSITNKVYGAVAYTKELWCLPVLLGLGGSYEFANKNALENWALWGKIGLNF